MKNSDLRGLDEDLARQARQTKKMGGPSDVLKRMKKRPGGTYNIRKTRRDGYQVGLTEEEYNRIFGNVQSKKVR